MQIQYGIEVEHTLSICTLQIYNFPLRFLFKLWNWNVLRFTRVEIKQKNRLKFRDLVYKRSRKILQVFNDATCLVSSNNGIHSSTLFQRAYLQIDVIIVLTWYFSYSKFPHNNRQIWRSLVTNSKSIQVRQHRQI